MESAATPFGKYQLLDRLAAGGMAEIYRARYTGAAGVTKPVVIKKILPHYAGNKNFVSMFINEAKIVVGLSHGNIAQVFDFGEIDGEYFLAMEYVHGQPLSRVLKRARAAGIAVLPTPFAVLVAMELCKGLHYAHTRLDESGKPLHIIHRDVSPQNVLVSYEGQVKIVDFGIAKARNATRGETEAGAVKGKYVYFSPEQARGKDLDSRSDVFATGILLFEMLCGRLPFEGKMIEVLSKIVRGEFPKPRSLNPDISPALERILLTALAHEKTDRYASAEAFQEALATYLHTHAPAFASSSLSMLMAYLFEEQLVAEGRPVLITPEFLAQVEGWKKPPAPAADPSATIPESDDQLTAVARPRALSADHPEEPKTAEATAIAHSGAFTQVPLGRRRLRWLFFAAPLAAMLIAGLLVVVVGHYSTFSVRLSSAPEGASVSVNGHLANAVTPLLVQDLASNAPHHLELTAPGHRPWSQTIEPKPGQTVVVHAVLLPIEEAPKPAPPRPAPVAPAPSSELRFPLSATTLDARSHAFVPQPSRTVRMRLDPARTYRIWTDGRIALGTTPDAPNIDEVFFVLEGPDTLPAREAFGLASPRPRLVRNASALLAFALDRSPSDNGGTLRVRVQEKGSSHVATLVLEGKNHCSAPTNGRLSIAGLNPSASYELTLKDAPSPAQTRAGSAGRPGRVAALLAPPPASSDGKKTAAEIARVFDVGRKHVITGTPWLDLFIPDDSAEDNQGALELTLVEQPRR